METSRILSKLGRYAPLVVLLMVAVGVRVYLYAHMHPVIHNDSVSYFFLSEIDSVRTPGYPGFLEAILCVNDLFSFTTDYLKWIVFVQMFGLGILSSLLLYRIACLLTGNRMFSLGLGILYNLNYFVISFEFQLLTESLSTVLLLLVLILYLEYFKGKKILGLVGGVLFVALVYTKPSFLLLGLGMPVLTFLLFFKFKGNPKVRRPAASVLLLFLIIQVLGIAGWSIRNRIKYDYFGVTTILPFNLRMYTNPLIHKYQPTGDAQIDRIAAIYAEEYAKTGSGSPTYFNFEIRAMLEMKLTDIQVSRDFLKVNLKLLRDYPSEYFQRVPDSFTQYYRQYSPYWAAGNARPHLAKGGLVARLLRFFFRIYKFLFVTPYLAWGVVIAAPLILLWLKRKDRFALHGWLQVEAAIHYNCLIAVFTTFAGVNNLRYRAAVEPLILLVLFAVFFELGKVALGRLKAQA